MKHYFKYKSLSGDSFKYFVKMLVEGKMYAAKFSELNDPMEGAYLSEKEIKGYFNKKENERIISLVGNNGQEKPCNMLMWSHYGDEHRGCCIEFRFLNKEDEEETLPVNYVDKIKAEGGNSIEKILRRKFTDWKYEQEVRHLGKEKLVPIVIDKIYLGMRIDDMYNEDDHTNEDFYRELVTRLCPNVELIKMCAEDFDGHHLDTLKE